MCPESPVDTGPSEGPRSPSVPRGPLAIALVAVVIGLVFVGARHFIAADGDLSRFVVAGHVFVDEDALDPPIHVFDSGGYDGQFYYRQALDPTLTTLDDERGIRLDQELRISRVGYPTTAYLLSAGRPDWVPEALVAVNLLALGCIAGAAATIAARRGLPPWYGLLPAASSGLLMALGRDLTEVLMVAGLVAGIACVMRERWVLATGAWTVAVLTHEQAIVVVATYGVFRIVGLVRGRVLPSRPDLPWIVSGLAVLAIQVVVARDVGVLPILDSGGGNATFPFVGLLPELAGWLTGDLAKQELLVLPELALVGVLVAVAFRHREKVPAEHRWIAYALLASAVLATLLSRNIWVGPAELRQIVIVPTMAWLVLMVSSTRVPWWLVGSTAAVWSGVFLLRVAAI